MTRPLRAWALAAAAAGLGAPVATPVFAQYAASVDLASRYRYRGTDLGPPGPVVRASVMADATSPAFEGAYAGLSATWHPGRAELQGAEALLGISRRLDAWPALSALSAVDARWAWDAGLHLLRYGGSSRYDFHEFMLGLLAPAGALRVWWSPHYFGGRRASLYTELNSGLDLADGWRLFGHAGWLRYGGEPSPSSEPDRIDGLVGVSRTLGRWELRMMRDGRALLGSRGPQAGGRFAARWVLSAGISF